MLELFGGWLSHLLLAILDLRSTRFERITDRVLHEAEAKMRRLRAQYRVVEAPQATER